MNILGDVNIKRDHYFIRQEHKFSVHTSKYQRHYQDTNDITTTLCVCCVSQRRS